MLLYYAGKRSLDHFFWISYSVFTAADITGEMKGVALFAKSVALPNIGVGTASAICLFASLAL
jgi:hypothetical protein